jgi:hypothetical protein
MAPRGFNEGPAATHRQDLLREARQARLVAQATAATGGRWSAALLKVADLLLYAGHRLRVSAAHRRLARTHAALQGEAAGACYHRRDHQHAHRHGEAFPPCVVWIDR